MLVPAELVEDTLDELLQLLVATGILLLTMVIATLRILKAESGKSWLSWVSNILTVVLLAEFMVWSVDTVLWLGVQIAAVSVLCPNLSAHSPLALSDLHSRTDPLIYSKQLVLSMGGYIVADLGQGTFVKMVHNGIEYGIMQAYAEGFNILHDANAWRSIR